MTAVVLTRPVQTQRAELRELQPATDWRVLEGICRRATGPDPFARSPAYFAMTGRKGLWLYATDDTAMLVCRHPNRADRLLMFWPMGRDPEGLLAAAARDDRLPAGRRQVARVDANVSGLDMPVGVVEQEDVLDWAFPVHVISTSLVKERKGGTFNNLRGHLNRAARAGLTARPVVFGADDCAIESIVAQWADMKDRPGFTRSDLIGPTLACLHLAATGVRSLGAVIVHEGSTPVGFWLWEELPQEGAAASLVRVSIGQHGAAELAAAAAADRLAARGIERLCLGGSETASLDAFKRKLGPTQSIPLATVALPT